jgi:hypothetical protein
VSRRRTVALCLLGVVVAGCGTGRQAEVLREHTSITGLNVNLHGSTIQVRNVFATPTATGLTQVRPGETLLLHFHVYNRSDHAELMTLAPPAVLAGPGVVGGTVPIGPRNSVTVGAPNGTGITASIPKVSQPVWVGTYVPVTLAFATAGHVDMTVPVQDASVAEF